MKVIIYVYYISVMSYIKKRCRRYVMQDLLNVVTNLHIALSEAGLIYILELNFELQSTCVYIRYQLNSTILF